MPSIEYNTEFMNTNFRSEMLLNRSPYNMLDMRTDKVALAQCIQNLVMFNPGTYPNQPQLGVGIENYLFELSDNETLDNIRTNIESQLKLFIPTDYKVSFKVTKDTTNNSLNILNIDFNIIDSKDSEVLQYSMNFGASESTKKVVSRLI